MSRLEQLVRTPGARIVTAEMPMIDTGGFAAVQRHLDNPTPGVDAINATDKTAAPAAPPNVAMAVDMTPHGPGASKPAASRAVAARETGR